MGNTMTTPTTESVDAAGSAEVNEVLLQFANQVCVEYSLKTQWSSWHNWVEHNDYSFVPAEYKNNSLGFMTCVDEANLVAVALRELLASTPGYEQYAEFVQLHHDGRHCVAVLRLPSVAIVMDISVHLTAFAIPLDGFVDTMPFYDFRGELARSRYDYHIFKGSEVPVLTTTYIPPAGQGPCAEAPFADISYDDAVERIKKHYAKRLVNVEGKLVPTKKYLTITSVSQHAPQYIPSLYLGNAGYGWTSCRLKIDFVTECVTMQIPVMDWLNTPAAGELAEAVRNSDVFKEHNIAVGDLVLDLSPEARQSGNALERSDLVGKVGASLGLPESEFAKMVASVYKVWDNKESWLNPTNNVAVEEEDDDSDPERTAETAEEEGSDEEEISDEEMEDVSDEDTEEAISDEEIVDPI
jgi:hypothetical protein